MASHLRFLKIFATIADPVLGKRAGVGASHQGGVDVLRFIRRSVAPLMVGALVASTAIAVADDVLPLHGALAQNEGAGDGDDARTPTDELDLDALIAEESEFDTDSVFPDLSGVGEIFGLYEYGEEDTVDVASELELLVPDDRADEFDSGEVDVVTETEAADEFLLSRDCNSLLALGVREQVSRPIRVNVLRDDLELIAQVENLLAGTDLPEGVPPISSLPGRVLIGVDGTEHVLPLEALVEVGRVTVSVLDLDLIRARPATLLEDLVTGAGLEGLLPAQVTPDTLSTPEFYETLWKACLHQSAEEGTRPFVQTVGGSNVWSLHEDPPVDELVDPTSSGTDVVTWLEEGLEIRVEANFDDVEDRFAVNPAVELDTQRWLEVFADPAQVAVQVGTVIVNRESDPTDLLVREAFAPPEGLEYGEGIPGVEETARHALSEGGLDVQSILGDPTAPGPVTFESQLERVVARGLFREGAIAENQRRRFATPIPREAVHSLPPVPAVGFVQVAVWDPQFLNSDQFREGWRRGIADAADAVLDLESLIDELVDPDELLSDPAVQEALDDAGIDVASLPERQREEITREVIEESLKFELGVVDFAVSTREGITRAHWLTPCFSASAPAEVPVVAVMQTQAEQREEIFGDRTSIFGEDLTGPALDDAPFDRTVAVRLFEALLDAEILADLDLVSEVGPALDALRHDPELAREKFLEEFQAQQDEEDRRERAEEDAVRAVRCSSSNLQAFLAGEPVPDVDDNGIDDRLE